MIVQRWWLGFLQWHVWDIAWVVMFARLALLWCHICRLHRVHAAWVWVRAARSAGKRRALGWESTLVNSLDCASTGLWRLGNLASFSLFVFGWKSRTRSPCQTKSFSGLESTWWEVNFLKEFYFILWFFETVFLWDFGGWPGTSACLEFTEICLPLPLLGLKACAGKWTFNRHAVNGDAMIPVMALTSGLGCSSFRGASS